MVPGFSALLLDGSGVVPDPMNWSNIAPGASSGVTETLTVSGIGEDIPLRVIISSVVWTGGLPGSRYANLYAIVDGIASGDGSAANGDEFDFTVRNGSQVLFSAAGDSVSAWSVTFTATVKYRSPGSSTFDQTLDAFDVSLSGEGSGSGGGGDPPGGGGGQNEN